MKRKITVSAITTVPESITKKAAAQLKGCSVSHIERAIQKNEIDYGASGGLVFVIVNQKWQSFLTQPVNRKNKSGMDEMTTFIMKRIKSYRTNRNGQIRDVMDLAKYLEKCIGRKFKPSKK